MRTLARLRGGFARVKRLCAPLHVGRIKHAMLEGLHALGMPYTTSHEPLRVMVSALGIGICSDGICAPLHARRLSGPLPLASFSSPPDTAMPGGRRRQSHPGAAHCPDERLRHGRRKS